LYPKDQKDLSMTGGIGFTRQGESSIRNNRNILSNRSKMKDNPYAATEVKTVDNNAEHLETLKQYQTAQKVKEDKNNRKVFFILLGILLMLLIYIFIFA
jgi:hypothetical protein